MVERFLPVALRKLNDLVKREDFVRINGVAKSKVLIKFKSKSCIIDNLGKVEWMDE